MLLRFLPFLTILSAALSLSAQLKPDVASLTRQYCTACHQGKSSAGGLDIAALVARKTLAEDPAAWSRILARVRHGEMPPKGAPAPTLEEREQFIDSIDGALKTAACSQGVTPGPYP